jgi:hypothetical protein
MSIRRIIQYARFAADNGTDYREGIMNKIVIASLGALLVTTVAFAYEIHHPNLNDAYSATETAIQHIREAQGHNRRDGEFGGHADAAIGHLRMAEKEIAAADRWNDMHHHH